ncbi:MAG: ATP-binding protein [Bacteroidales bacterium]|nr:ATP-binding protein [Bacteroidales bacterium]
MILGGIPYYLNYFKRGRSLAQNVDALFFDDRAHLSEEYDRLFSSVFSSPDELKKIVAALAGKRSGLSRDEISQKTHIDPNGNLTKMLNALIASDFVTRYVPFGESKRNELYKLTDPFCIFYLHFVGGHDSLNADFWTMNQSSQSIVSWRGLAFEEVCLRHVNQIKGALGISGVASRQSAWSVKGSDDVQGNQIDLLIERKDNVVNMCEMKFYNDEFVVSKSYERVMVSRFNSLKECLPKRFAIHNTLVTTYGLKYNEYSGTFQNVVTIDDLFR